VFRLNRNERSHWSGNGVHVESELVFMIGRNMHPYRVIRSHRMTTNEKVARRKLSLLGKVRISHMAQEHLLVTH